MANQKFWRLKMKGDLSLEDVQAAVVDREGMLLRVHTEEKETDIYFSSTTRKAPEKTATTKLQVISLKEVTLADVTKIR